MQLLPSQCPSCPITRLTSIDYNEISAGYKDDVHPHSSSVIWITPRSAIRDRYYYVLRLLLTFPRCESINKNSGQMSNAISETGNENANRSKHTVSIFDRLQRIEFCRKPGRMKSGWDNEENERPRT